MPDMEHRAWITITGFPAASDEDRWTPFMQQLEQNAAEYGPIISWDDEHVAQICMSSDQHDLDAAAEAFMDAIVDTAADFDLRGAKIVAIEFEVAAREIAHA